MTGATVTTSQCDVMTNNDGIWIKMVELVTWVNHYNLCRPTRWIWGKYMDMGHIGKPRRPQILVHFSRTPSYFGTPWHTQSWFIYLRKKIVASLVCIVCWFNQQETPIFWFPFQVGKYPQSLACTISPVLDG